MPFNVLNLSTGNLARDGDVIASFESPAYAAAYAADLTRLTGEKHQPRVALSDDWQAREASRFQSGEYLPVAWQYSAFWDRRSQELREHFCHRSKDKPAFIAFTESPEKGSRDVQTRLRPGVYLKRYFGDVLSDAEITQYARLHAMLSGETEYDVKFATTGDAIQWAYENGPASCMSETARHYSGDCHPVRVYGDSDLQLAYIKAESSYHDKQIMARALVWPERKVYGRVYPTPERYLDEKREEARAAQAALVTALESLGYSAGRFDGAKIRKIENESGGFVMPYLDGTQEVSDAGDMFTIDRCGEFCCTETNGVVGAGDECENCGGTYQREDGVLVYTSPRLHHSQTWCSDCASERGFYCYGSDEQYSDNVESVTMDGHTYTYAYARDNFYFCERMEEWNSDGTTEVNVRHGNTEQWCADALEDAFHCDGSCEWYASDAYTSVEVNGETYEESYAFLNGLLSKQGDETETAAA